MTTHATPSPTQTSPGGAVEPEPVRISLILARARNGVIGADSRLPWHISADLQQFKRLTVGKPVIMGRKTFESIGRPLPRRTNIVVTRDKNWRAESVLSADNLPSAFALAYEDLHRTGAREVMVIGGAEIYRAALAHAQRIYLTEIQRDYPGDAAFADDFSRWREIAREDHTGEAPDGPAFSFVTLERPSK